MDEDCSEAIEQLVDELEKYLDTEELSLENEALDCYAPVVGDHAIRVAVQEVQARCYNF